MCTSASCQNPSILSNSKQRTTIEPIFILPSSVCLTSIEKKDTEYGSEPLTPLPYGHPAMTTPQCPEVEFCELRLDGVLNPFSDPPAILRLFGARRYAQQSHFLLSPSPEKLRTRIYEGISFFVHRAPKR